MAATQFNLFTSVFIIVLSKTILKAVGDGVVSFDINEQPHQLTTIGQQNDIFPWDKLGKGCPDGKSKCPGEKHCCAMGGGKFGCCKFNKGVCCSDMKTCCPHGTVCDAKNNACTSPSENLLPLLNEFTENVKSQTVCPDQKMECETFETCCSLGYGRYGCCPFKNATCCSDNASCCPHNKKCDLKKKQCVPKEDLKSVIVERKPLMTYLNEIDLKNICPNNSRCRAGETCCSISSNRYACCPFSAGVCCSDMKTCCNQGYQCVNNGCSLIGV